MAAATVAVPLRRTIGYLVADELHLVAGPVEAGDLEFFRRDAGHAENRHLQFASLLKPSDLLATPVEKITGDIDVDLDVHAMDSLAVGRELHQPHHFDAHALDGLDLAGPDAVRAFLRHALLQRRPDALARHFDQAEL